jgi:hypothetical protein
MGTAKAKNTGTRDRHRSRVISVSSAAGILWLMRHRTVQNKYPVTDLLLHCASGEAAVGKSSLVLRFVSNDFNENNSPTIGAAFLTQSAWTSSWRETNLLTICVSNILDRPLAETDYATYIATTANRMPPGGQGHQV